MAGARPSRGDFGEPQRAVGRLDDASLLALDRALALFLGLA